MTVGTRFGEFLQSFSYSRELRKVERGVREGDPASIATVGGWSAKEVRNRFNLRFGYWPLLVYFAVLAASVSYRFSLWVAMLLYMLMAAPVDYLNRRSPILPLIRDPNWINFCVLDEGGLDEKSIRRFLDGDRCASEFKLTRRAEKRLQKRVDDYSTGTESGYFDERTGGQLAAEILGKYGNLPKSGKLLAKLASTDGEFSLEPELRGRFEQWHRQFVERAVHAGAGR